MASISRLSYWHRRVATVIVVFAASYLGFDQLKAEGNAADQEVPNHSREDRYADPGMQGVQVGLVPLTLYIVAGEHCVEREGGGNER